MRTKLIICDLDNTLYDWVRYFVPAFYAMVDAASKILNCDTEVLLDDLKAVHQKYHDTEHPFALLEANVVTETFPGMSRQELKRKFDDAFHAFNSSRIRNLYAYPDVERTLNSLKRSGLSIVAHTESKRHTALDRLNRLKIGQFFSGIYCQQHSDSSHPEGRAKPLDPRHLPQRIVELQHFERKPNPRVVMDICADAGFQVSEAAYVGDSLPRDVFMAKQAGCYAVWAEYGTWHDDVDYRKLIRISHWSTEDIQRERELNHLARGVEPDSAIKCFADIKKIFERQGLGV